MDSVSKNICVQCNKSPGDPEFNYYGLAMCKSCFNQMIAEIKEYKAARTEIYPEIDKILDNLYLGM